MKKIIHKMKTKSFDVTHGGILIFKDPLIGKLENPGLQLSVKLNREERQLELRHRDRLLSTFDLPAGAAKACHQSFAAYFSTLETLMHPTRQTREAA